MRFHERLALMFPLMAALFGYLTLDALVNAQELWWAFGVEFVWFTCLTGGAWMLGWYEEARR